MFACPPSHATSAAAPATGAATRAATRSTGNGASHVIHHTPVQVRLVDHEFAPMSTPYT
jgi:hypothetical protein